MSKATNTNETDEAGTPNEHLDFNAFEILAGLSIPTMLATFCYFKVMEFPFAPGLDEAILFWMRALDQKIELLGITAILLAGSYYLWKHVYSENIKTQAGYFGVLILTAAFFSFFLENLSNIILECILILLLVAQWSAITLLGNLSLKSKNKHKYIPFFCALLFVFWLNFKAYIVDYMTFPTTADSKMISVWKDAEKEYLISCDSPKNRLLKRPVGFEFMNATEKKSNILEDSTPTPEGDLSDEQFFKVYETVTALSDDTLAICNRTFPKK